MIVGKFMAMSHENRTRIKRFEPVTHPNIDKLFKQQGYIKPIEKTTHRSETMKELFVFTNTGNTYYFANVENLKPTKNGFKFAYTEITTNKKRTATFDNTSTAGYALSDM